MSRSNSDTAKIITVDGVNLTPELLRILKMLQDDKDAYLSTVMKGFVICTRDPDIGGELISEAFFGVLGDFSKLLESTEATMTTP